ncbi:hypothetical protein [Streptomyces sp. NPDC002845]
MPELSHRCRLLVLAICCMSLLIVSVADRFRGGASKVDLYGTICREHRERMLLIRAMQSPGSEVRRQAGTGAWLSAAGVNRLSRRVAEG